MGLLRILSIVSLAVVAYALPSKSAVAQSTAQNSFSERLHIDAERRDPTFGPRYFAIVRRGLAQFKELERAVGPEAAAVNVDINTINDTPEATDKDKTDQYITSLALGIAPRKMQTRVVGAQPAVKGEWEQVVIITGPEGICTGIMIDATTVLTATHCVCELKLTSAGANEIHVTHDFRNTTSVAKSKVDPNSIVTFAKDSPSAFDPCASRGDFFQSLQLGFPDIAIVRTTSSLPGPFMKLAAPHLLQTSLGVEGTTAQRRNGNFTVVGFGCMVQPRIENGRETCPPSAVEIKAIGMIQHSWFCAGTGCIPQPKEFVLQDLRDVLTPVDTCIGDSGGPAILIKPDGDGNRARLAGITSRPRVGRNCGAGGIYGQVATREVLCWLKKNKVSPDAMPEFDTGSCG